MTESTVETGTSASGEVQLRRRWTGVSEPWATVLIVHGAFEHSGRFDHVARQMVEAGIEVHSFDWIGHGESGGDRVDIDTWSTYWEDLAERLASVRRPDVPVVLYGHSMGGLIALGYCLSAGDLPDGLVLSAPWLEHAASPILKAIAPIVGKVAPRQRVDGKLTGDMFSRDPRVGEAYFSDPLIARKATFGWGAAVLVEQARVRNGLRDLGIPVFVVHGGADPIAPPSCSVPVGELPGAERRLFPSLRHEPHNEPEGAEVVASVIDWMRRHWRD